MQPLAYAPLRRSANSQTTQQKTNKFARPRNRASTCLRVSFVAAVSVALLLSAALVFVVVQDDADQETLAPSTSPPTAPSTSPPTAPSVDEAVFHTRTLDGQAVNYVNLAAAYGNVTVTVSGTGTITYVPPVNESLTAVKSTLLTAVKEAGCGAWEDCTAEWSDTANRRLRRLPGDSNSAQYNLRATVQVEQNENVTDTTFDLFVNATDVAVALSHVSWSTTIKVTESAVTVTVEVAGADDTALLEFATAAASAATTVASSGLEIVAGALPYRWREGAQAGVQSNPPAAGAQRVGAAAGDDLEAAAVVAGEDLDHGSDEGGSGSGSGFVFYNSAYVEGVARKYAEARTVQKTAALKWLNKEARTVPVQTAVLKGETEQLGESHTSTLVTAGNPSI